MFEWLKRMLPMCILELPDVCRPIWLTDWLTVILSVCILGLPDVCRTNRVNDWRTDRVLSVCILGQPDVFCPDWLTDSDTACVNTRAARYLSSYLSSYPTGWQWYCLCAHPDCLIPVFLPNWLTVILPVWTPGLPNTCLPTRLADSDTACVHTRTAWYLSSYPTGWQWYCLCEHPDCPIPVFLPDWLTDWLTGRLTLMLPMWIAGLPDTSLTDRLTSNIREHTRTARFWPTDTVSACLRTLPVPLYHRARSTTDGL